MIAIPQTVLGRKPALIAAGTAIAAILLLLALPVILMFSAQQREIESSLHRLAIYRAELGLRPALERQLSEARQRAAATPGLIAGESAPLAQAALQTDMKAIVEGNAGEIRSAQILPSTKSNGFETIAIQYDLSVPITHLHDLAYAIDTHTPYLFIDNVDINMPQYWQAADTSEPKLEIRWTVRGYRWAGGK